MSQPLHELLSRDALGEAERITGKSYKDDQNTMALGFAGHLSLVKAKESALKSARDSYFSMDLAETLDLYRDLGFIEVLCDEFDGTSHGDEPAPRETFRILWHESGILATVESYGTTRRNDTKVYYNVAIRDRSDLWSRISSGHLGEGDIWVGDHDAREGVRNAIERLGEIGDFLTTWTERPFLWLVTYAETKVDGYDYAAINADRISRLPERVQQAISPEAGA